MIVEDGSLRLRLGRVDDVAEAVGYGRSWRDRTGVVLRVNDERVEVTRRTKSWKVSQRDSISQDGSPGPSSVLLVVNEGLGR